MDEHHDPEDTFPIEIPGNVLRRQADRAMDYKLGKLTAAYESIAEQLQRNEEEAQRQWASLHEEIGEKGLGGRLKKIEGAYNRAIGGIGVLSVLLTLLVSLYELARDWLAAHLH
jgi:hypothetical protein